MPPFAKRQGGSLGSFSRSVRVKTVKISVVVVVVVKDSKLKTMVVVVVDKHYASIVLERFITPFT